MSVKIVFWFGMGEMIVLNILVDMVAELNFQMDMTVEWDFQMSDKCDDISSKLWLFAGLSEDSESLSYGCLFSADVDRLLNGYMLLCWFDPDKLFGCGGLLISCNLHGCIWWYELPFLTRTCLSCPSTFAGPCHWLLLSLLQ